MKDKKVKKSPKQTKQVSKPESTDTKEIIWIFDKLDKNGDFAFDIKSSNFKAEEFLIKMIEYSLMTWADIKKQTHDDGKSKHHFLEIDKLSKAAKERVSSMQIDVNYPDSIFSFAFDNLLRIIGIRINEKFHVVWYDPKHEFCPSTLKHT